MMLAHVDPRTLLAAAATWAMLTGGCAAPTGGGGGGGGDGTVTRDLEFDTGEAGELQVTDGEEATGTGMQDLSNDVPFNPQFGTIAVLDDDILFGDAGPPKGSVAAQGTERSATIRVYLAPAEVDGPCTDPFQVLSFTATESATGVVLSNASSSLGSSTLALIVGGEFQFCIGALADFNGTVSVRRIRISVVGDVSDDDGNANNGNSNDNGDDDDDDSDNGNGVDDDDEGSGDDGNGNSNGNDDDGVDGDDDSGDAAQSTRFTATLTGDTQVPTPVVTDTTGFAEFELNADGTVLSYSLVVRDGVDILFAHIHAGAAGENGLVVADLFAPDETLAFADGEIASGQIRADDLLAVLSGQPLSALVDLLLTGDAYVNVHSVANSTGEVRGQINPDDNPDDDDTLPPDDNDDEDSGVDDAKRFAASLSGDEQPVPVVTTTTGSAEFELSEDGQSLSFSLSVFNGVDVLNAHIHAGAAGEEGGVIANLFTPDDPLAASDGEIASGTLTSADLTGTLSGGSLVDLIDLLIEGNAYVNVHTIANPSGEVRGQIFPADADDIDNMDMDDDGDIDPNNDGQQFRAELSGDKQVPDPVATAATGDAVFTLSDDGMSLSYTLSVFDGANIDVAHIHLGSANQNGSVVVFLFGEATLLGEANGQIAAGTITEADFQGPLAGAPFSDLIDALSVGEAYVNVHTLENPAGELRGQIEPVE